MFIIQARQLKKNFKSINSAIISLKDAVANNLGEISNENILDNIDIIMDKCEISTELLKNISELLDKYSDYTQIWLILNDTYSLLKILKYSLKARRSQIDYDDIFNCLNIISRHTVKLFEYGNILAKLENPDNVTPLWNN